ncbi:MAG TPA: FAD binding domain-containing protein [Acidimicrobiia bacterium]|nr:FAD binding domain-containing protein [Acidimicrobiia bacterium]
MDVLLPRTLPEALEMKAARPDARPIAGGTDVMVEINFGHARPAAIIDVSRLPELAMLRREDGFIHVGAGVTYTRLIRELDDLGPMTQAARTVGSPQIRHRGTLGGNLGTASPAGDALPVLAAYDATVEVASAARGSRRISWNEFLVGPKRTALQPDELILGASWRAVRGAGSFSKVGTRNAMVIAVVGLCLVLDADRQQVRVALGSVGPTILRATEAEHFARGVLERGRSISPEELDEFGTLVAGAARPIDDVRGTASYRRLACAVLARRALSWALAERC